MDRRRTLAIAAGGVAGAGLRWAVLTATTTPPGELPRILLAVNVAGSFLLGGILAAEATHPRAHLLLHDLAGIGFCGGLTTFSTFAVEVVDLVRDGEAATAVTYGVLSVLGSAGAVAAGAAALHRVRAVTIPLEEEP